MFEAGKLFWIVFAPANLLLLALLAIWLALPRKRGSTVRGWLGALLAISFLIACTPLGRLPLALLEDRFAPAPLPDKIDGIIVLGGGISPAISLGRNEPGVAVAAPRLLAFADLARRFPDAKLVFTGGSGDIFNPDVKEAPIARQALQKMGMNVDRVVFEDRARNTYENALFSHALVVPKPGETWLLVTSAAHMPRSVGTFRQQGWQVIAWPVGYWTSGNPWRSWGFDFLGGLSSMQGALREWTGLIAYYVRGYSDSLLPAP